MGKKDLVGQKPFPTIIKIIISCYLFICIDSLSQAPIWLINSDIQAGKKSIYKGVVTVVSNSAYVNGASTALYIQAYTTAFSVIPNVGISTPTIDITPAPTYMQWKVNLPQSTNQTHFKLNMNYRTTAFKTFKVGFIAVSGSITYLKVDYKQLTFSTGISTGTGDRSATGNFNLNIVINAANQLSLIPYLSGLKISTTSGDYKFQLKFTKNTNTNVLYNATVSGTTKVTEIVAYIMIYDVTLGQQSQTLFLDYQPLTGINNTLNAYSLVFFDKTNILVGVGQFSFTSGFSFNLITDNLTLTVPSSGSGAYFTSISFSFWSFRKRSCSASTPYYEKTANLCYDTCSVGYLPVDPDKYCNSCSSYMAHCTRCDTSTKCTQCQATWSVKNDQTGCQCSEGYYLNGLVCSPCDSSCKTCSGGLATNCLTCKNNTFYLDQSNRCTACANPCKTCSSSTACLSCVDGYFLQALTNICQSCDFQCVTCSGSTATDCLTCNEVDRTLTGTQCVCKSGTEDESGNCISLCDDVNCMVCTQDAGFCQQCKDASFILSGGQCRCPTTHYYSTLNTTCYPCHSTCALCSGPTQNDCVSCFSSQNRQLNTTTFKCECKPTYYSPNSELTCIKQPSVTTCPQNFVFNPTMNVCVEICGDGKLFQLPCDDGNLDPKDGCDQNCNIQSGFQCLYGDHSSPSICSYSGQISFVLLTSIKEPLGNQLRLTYRLQPELKFYEKFFDFTNNLLISDTTLIIVNASYYKDQKTLHVKISYNQSVSGKTVQFSYVPPSSPYFHSTLRASFSWPVSVSNGLSLNYYPQQIYENTKIFEKLILGIFIGCLVVAFFSLFFRKMIGAQLIILAQTQILSVTMLDEIHPYLTPLISDKFVFGYNDFQDIINMNRATQITFNKMYSILGFSNVFGQNVNIMLFVVIFIYLVSLVLGLSATMVQKSTSKKMKKAAIILATEIAFGSLIFILMNITTSYIIEVFQSTIWQFNPEYSGALKIVAIILIAANYAVYIIFFKESTESYVFYNKRSRLSQIIPLVIATKAILIAVGIGLYSKFGVSMCYTLISLQVLYVLFLIGIRPFKRVIDLIRAIVVELSIAYVIGSRFVLSEFVNLSSPGDWNTFLEVGVPGQYGLTGLCLVLSFVSLLIHLIKVNKHEAQIHPQEAYSDIDLFDKKQQSPQKNAYQKEPDTIQSYIEDFLDKNKQYSTDFSQQKEKPLKFKKQKKQKGLFTSEDLKLNSSLGKLIDISEIQIDDGLGNDSRRKIKNENNRQRNKINKNLEIIQMDDD